MAILVERDNIGIFGKMNAGKSSIMNLLTQQKTSIVDDKPGTTADTKTAVQEIHGMGPIRIFDTAGADETGRLGDKKREKISADLKESDLVLIIMNPESKEFTTEQHLLKNAREQEKQILIIYNIFSSKGESEIKTVEQKIPLLKFHKKLIIQANNLHERKKLIDFILENFESKNHKTEVLPFIQKNNFYVLIIPMDEETPPGRYLRPQAMVEEYITRNWAYPVSFRLDLGKARSKDSKEVEEEKMRFFTFLKNLKQTPHAIITDSQAMDIMYPWCPKEVLLTTFSITMINYVSKGQLWKFAEGIKAFEKLKKNDTILIVEACNHSRIGEDIGTVQIPNFFKKHYPDIKIEHNFGREFHDNKQLEKYKMIIHCGGCMITAQKLNARIRDLNALNIPYTNYGIFLSYMQGEKALNKVLEPWNEKT